MVTSGDSGYKILLFNKKKNRTSWIQSDALLKSTLTKKKNISYKEKDLINKVKCFTENDNREVWKWKKTFILTCQRSALVEIK